MYSCSMALQSFLLPCPHRTESSSRLFRLWKEISSPSYRQQPHIPSLWLGPGGKAHGAKGGCMGGCPWEHRVSALGLSVGSELGAQCVPLSMKTFL